MRSWHVTWSSDGRHPLFPSEESRRRAVRALARVAGHSISLLCLVDDHVHVVLWCDDARVLRLCRSIGMARAPIAAVKLDRPFSRPFRDRGRMDWLAHPYILRQPWKHGPCQVDHPALWSGSCSSDLVGARALDGLSLRIGDALPRFVLRRACRTVFLSQGPIVRASEPDGPAYGGARRKRVSGRPTSSASKGARRAPAERPVAAPPPPGPNLACAFSGAVLHAAPLGPGPPGPRVSRARPTDPLALEKKAFGHRSEVPVLAIPMNNQRYIVMAFLAAGAFIGLALRGLAVPLLAQIEVPDPVIVGSLTATGAVGIAVGFGTFLFLLRHPRAYAFTDRTVHELKKSTWPDRDETVRSTTVVLGTTAFVAAVLAGYDLVWARLTNAFLFTQG